MPTTVNAGGTLAAAAGTSIELNGALLVNNGTQGGALNVNYGATARGSGQVGDVTVNEGGQFGTNSVGGGNTNAVNGAAAGITGFVPGEFAVDFSGFTNDLQGGSFAVIQADNNRLVLAFTAVPEPGTWAVLALGGVVLVTIRRRTLARG